MLCIHEYEYNNYTCMRFCLFRVKPISRFHDSRHVPTYFKELVYVENTFRFQLNFLFIFFLLGAKNNYLKQYTREIMEI